MASGNSNLNLIPDNLVCFHIQIEAASVPAVNGSALGFIRIIYYTELAILHISMHLNIVIGAEPPVQVFLIMGAPQDGTVQQAAVLKAVGQSAHIHSTALAELVDGQADTLALLHQNLSALQRIHIFLILTEIDLALAVFRDKVLMHIPVILVVSQSKSGLLLNAKHICQLDKASVCLMAGGLADSDQAAALIDKFLDRSDDLGIAPPFSAGVRGICITHVQDYVNII